MGAIIMYSLYGPYHVSISHSFTETPDLDMFDMHAHDVYELFCFLSGSAEYYVEGTVYPLARGDILLLKKAEAHTLLIKARTPYERIVMHFAPGALMDERKAELIAFLDNRPLGKFNHYPAAIFRNTHWLYYLEQIVSSTSRAHSRVYLNVLIRELFYASAKLHSPNLKKDTTTDIIHYINEHLTQPLSIQLLCEKFYISKSQLTRNFQKATGSKVWDYVLTKRLLLARDLLKNGASPTAACTQSGFNDYSSFYRIYKARFGVSPKNDQYRSTDKQE